MKGRTAPQKGTPSVTGSAGGRVAAMTKWEYQVAPIPLHNEALMLNNFGQDGWELVAIQTNAQGGLVAFLKRPAAGSEG